VFSFPGYHPAVVPGGPLLAHPISQPGGLSVSPLVAAVGAAVAAGILVMIWPSTKRSPPLGTAPSVDPWEGTLRPAQVATRSVGVLLLLAAIVAGRLGSVRELENLAPALVVGVGWPGLVILSSTLGPVWRWLDPWDGVARALVHDAGSSKPVRPSEASVWPAVLPAAAWTWYLSVFPSPTDPRSIGLALGLYTIWCVGGCVALGRRSWLPRAEVFGLLFGWLARLPRGLLRGWEPPRGSEAVLGVLAGGLLFGTIRLSELWGRLNAVEGAVLVATAGLAGSVLLYAGLLLVLGRVSEDARGSVLVGAVPLVGAVAVAVGLARSRLTTSLAVLPSVAADPLGRGWDLFGTADTPIGPPLPADRLALVQLATLALGAVAAAVVVAGRRPSVRGPAAVAAAGLTGGATLAVMVAPGLVHG
jgi:hypothetical protein